MGQAISLLLIGGGLILIPLLLPTVSVSLFGQQGAAIHNTIGSAGQPQTFP